MDHTYLIDVARTEYREGFNTGDADRVASVFAPEFTDNANGLPRAGTVRMRRRSYDYI